MYWKYVKIYCFNNISGRTSNYPKSVPSSLSEINILPRRSRAGNILSKETFDFNLSVESLLSSYPEKQN